MLSCDFNCSTPPWFSSAGFSVDKGKIHLLSLETTRFAYLDFVLQHFGVVAELLNGLLVIRYRVIHGLNLLVSVQ